MVPPNLEAAKHVIHGCWEFPVVNVTVSGASRTMDQPGHGGEICVEDLWKLGYRLRRTLAASGRVAGGASAARTGPQRCRWSNPAARHKRIPAREGADVGSWSAQAFARVANWRIRDRTSLRQTARTRVRAYGRCGAPVPVCAPSRSKPLHRHAQPQSQGTRDPHQRREAGVAVRGERLVDPDSAQACLTGEPGHAVRPGDVVERRADALTAAAALGNARTVTAEHLEHAVAELRL